MPDLPQQLIDYISRPGYKPMRARTLAKNLGITKKRLAQFEGVLEELAGSGRVRISDSGRVQPPVPSNSLTGVIRRISSGAAFLIPHEPRPRGVTGDVYIDESDLRDAQNGDVALVRLAGKRPNGQRWGVVTEVLERATSVFVGTYFEEDDAGWVQIDGRDFRDPIWVGDPGAKGAIEGDKVVIEMLRFPTHRQPGEAVLTQVLGARGKPGVDTQMIIHEFGLPFEYPEAALAEARLEAENFNEEQIENREDLTGELIITIDPVDARDFDDAISLARDDKGHWLLGVHIADVAHFVQPGSELDKEALRRGTSVYLPTLVIPMLPEVISNGLASLQEKRVRLTRSVFIEYTPEGIPVHTRFANSVIKVARRFAYEEVLPIVQEGEKHRGQVPAKIRKLLAEMHELAMLLRRRRIKKGYLELDMPEIKLELDANQQVTGAHETVHDESHQMIEEFMLAANIAVAQELTDRGLGYLRRIHAEPNSVKLEQFKQLATALGYEIRNPQSRRELQGLLRDAKGQSDERAINFALLRSLKRAEYSALPQGHYALAEENYCHFTSPIRRYPDLTIHRLMEGLWTKNPVFSPPGSDELLQLGRHCSLTERRAADAERELVNLKLLSYLESRVGEELDAEITGVERYGFFVRGVRLPAEGLVHVTSLSEHDYFDFDRDTMTLTARRSGRVFRLGDKVRVAVAHVDVDRRELDFKLVKWLGGGKRPERRRDRSAFTSNRPGKRKSDQQRGQGGKPSRRRNRR